MSEFCSREFMIWAAVSSRSCFCWLYRPSPSLGAKTIISLMLVLTIWWCPCVESSLALLEVLSFPFICFSPLYVLCFSFVLCYIFLLHMFYVFLLFVFLFFIPQSIENNIQTPMFHQPRKKTLKAQLKPLCPPAWITHGNPSELSTLLTFSFP